MRRTENDRWRNFTIHIDDNRFLSLGQFVDDESLAWHSNEVALFVNNKEVGDPVSFVRFDFLAEVIEAATRGDYKIFERHYAVSLDLFDHQNENNPPQSG